MYRYTLAVFWMHIFAHTYTHAHAHAYTWKEWRARHTDLSTISLLKRGIIAENSALKHGQKAINVLLRQILASARVTHSAKLRVVTDTLNRVLRQAKSVRNIQCVKETCCMLKEPYDSSYLAMGSLQLLHRHFVLGQCAGLVRADHLLEYEYTCTCTCIQYACTHCVCVCVCVVLVR
jgi:hypothetical protein